MKTTILLATTLVIVLCGFTSAEKGAQKFGPSDPPPKSDKMDSSQSTIDMYVNGTIKTTYWVQVHKDPKAGQYWETRADMAGMKMTTRWQIAKVDGDTATVEQESKMDSEYMVSDYVIAYQVDLTKDVGEVNVTKAWVGKPGEEGKKIQVMDKPEAAACGGGCAPEVESTTEDFTDLEMAGGKWSGKVTTTKVYDTESKVWIADNGWFGGMIKMQSGDYVNELTAFGDDGKALLKWADDKADEKKDDADKKDPETDGKKDDGKKDDGKKDDSGKK